MSGDFFAEQAEASAVKTAIVTKYFNAWCHIMKGRSERIGYLDLYAGPGRYESGEDSTPMIILRWAVAAPEIASRLVTVFNDANPDYTEALTKGIERISGIERLKYKPQILTGDLSDELVKQFEEMRTIPALTFIDPWGYKGLSLRLIRAVIKDWGCDVIFFFNYNRINMGITNPNVQHHMAALFGPEGLATLQRSLAEATTPDREMTIRNALGEALTAMGAPFLIPFVFRRDDGRVSHYICFVSKHELGFSIMKEIMATNGSVDEDGVPLFEYVPAGAPRQLRLDYRRPLLDLPDLLLEEFAGRTITVGDIYDQHNVGTPYVKANYKEVLKAMELEGRVTCEQDHEHRKKNTIADRILVTFPPR